jgi:hypothetical protein
MRACDRSLDSVADAEWGSTSRPAEWGHVAADSVAIIRTLARTRAPHRVHRGPPADGDDRVCLPRLVHLIPSGSLGIDDRWVLGLPLEAAGAEHAELGRFW